MTDGATDLQDGANDVEDDLSFVRGILPGLIMWAVSTTLLSAVVAVLGEWAGILLQGGSQELFLFTCIAVFSIPLGQCLHRRITVEDALCINSFSDLRSVSVTKHLRTISSKRGLAYLVRGCLWGGITGVLSLLLFPFLLFLVFACLSIYVLFLCYLAFYGKSLKKLFSNDINRSLTQLWRLRSDQLLDYL